MRLCDILILAIKHLNKFTKSGNAIVKSVPLIYHARFGNRCFIAIKPIRVIRFLDVSLWRHIFFYFKGELL